MLPIFALANAGVIMTLGVVQTHGALMLTVVQDLVVGRPVGIVLASWLAVRFRLATKPPEYSGRQLTGAGALAGIGFTMSLFIAGEAFPFPEDFAAARIAIFTVSLVTGVVAPAILLPRSQLGS